MYPARLGLSVVLLGAIISFRPMPIHSAELFVGTWKLTLYQPGSELDVCLIKIVSEEGKQWRATVISRASPQLDISADKLSITGRKMELTIKVSGEAYNVVAMIPQDTQVTKLYASFGRRPDLQLPAVLEKTNEQELDPKKVTRQSPPNEALIAISRTANQERQRELLRTLLKQHGDHPVAIFATIELIDRLADLDAQNKEIEELATAAFRLASKHGPALEGYLAYQIGTVLLNSSKTQTLAATYLEKAASVLAQGPASFQVRLYKALAKSYRVAGQANKAERLVEKIEALERQADEEYRRTIPPFQVSRVQPRTEPGRALVLELFTGTQCPPCVAADVAFDAIGKAYPAQEVILLQYHLHIPRADPLTNPDTIKRSEFYNVRGTPTAFLNGKATPPLGGPMSFAEARYKTLVKLIEDSRQDPAPCRLELKATKHDRNLDIEANVTHYKNLPEKARLIFVLIEEEVRYAAPNGIRFHHHVVRAFPGGQDGFPLAKDKTHQTVRINLADLEKSLHDYLNTYAREESFPDDERPLELRKLKVIALIQDPGSREIFHAAIADVPE